MFYKKKKDEKVLTKHICKYTILFVIISKAFWIKH